jgi:hypothetical protein
VSDDAAAKPGNREGDAVRTTDAEERDRQPSPSTEASPTASEPSQVQVVTSAEAEVAGRDPESVEAPVEGVGETFSQDVETPAGVQAPEELPADVVDVAGTGPVDAGTEPSGGGSDSISDSSGGPDGQGAGGGGDA